MESIIQKAIEGGYENVNFEHASKYFHVCNPLFWKSLSKACEWKYDVLTNVRETFFAHNFNRNLGWNKSVEWLENLIKE